VQVNLADKKQRSRRATKSPAPCVTRVEAIGKKNGGNAKVVEVPPGPPVMSPIVAEIYGPDYKGQISVGKQVRGRFSRRRRTSLRSTTISTPILVKRAARATEQGGPARRRAERHCRGGQHGAGRAGRDTGAQCRLQV
jgi:hypothetical protein